MIMKNRRLLLLAFVAPFVLGVASAVMIPIVRFNPNSHWNLQPTKVFPYVGTPYWLSRPGFFSKEYYALHLEQAYGQFYNSKSVHDCLVAMDEVFFYQRVLIEKFHYKPVDILNSCASCADKTLPALAETAQYATPHHLQAGIIQYLKLLGVHEMVCSQIDHIFFVPDPKNYPDLFNDATLGTGDAVTRSILFSEPLDNLYIPMLAAGIAHEAFHLKYNNNYNSYPESEKEAFAFEIGLLQELLRLSPATLTDAEKTKIGSRIKRLGERSAQMK